MAEIGLQERRELREPLGFEAVAVGVDRGLREMGAATPTGIPAARRASISPRSGGRPSSASRPAIRSIRAARSARQASRRSASASSVWSIP